MKERTLLYNCCDDEYTHFIPIHCAAALFSNKNIDIEIGINLDKLTDKEESALSELKMMHPDTQIKIKYNFYQKTKTRGFDNATYNGIKMWSNTIRFISEPEIKDTYTYIGDIDVILLMKNFYNYHIDIMNTYHTDYSNWQRDNNPNTLTGLHFVKTNKYYPVNFENINLIDLDEHILKQIQTRICPINQQIPRRPVCGLHFSMNQKFSEQLKLCKKFIDELNSYKNIFFEFINSDEYNVIKKCNTNIINEYINKFKTYYSKL